MLSGVGMLADRTVGRRSLRARAAVTVTVVAARGSWGKH